MAYVALLDADVLHPWILCELLLRLAERGLYRPAWSEAILDELQSSLMRRMPNSPERVKRRREVMQSVFADAMTRDVATYLAVVPDEVEAGDRHVVAAAIAARADVIVTNNLSDFAPDALADVGLIVQNPDEFLIHQWWLDPFVVLEEIRTMATETSRPPLSVDEVLRSLERFAPVFVDMVRGSDEFGSTR